MRAARGPFGASSCAVKPRPDRRCHAEHLEELRTDGHADQALRVTAAGERVAGKAEEREVAGHAIQRAAVALHLLDDTDRVRARAHPLVAGIRSDPDEAIGVGKRQRTQHDRIHDAEHGRIRADADGQNDGDAQREGRRLDQPPHAIPDVGPGALQQRQPARVTMSLARGVQSADRHGGAAARFLAIDTACHEVVGGQLEVGLEFVVEVHIAAAPLKHRHASLPGLPQCVPHFTPPPVSPRTRPTMPVTRCQCAVSFASAARPRAASA